MSILLFAYGLIQLVKWQHQFVVVNRQLQNIQVKTLLINSMVLQQSYGLWLEAIKGPIGPRLGAPVLLSLRQQTEQSMTLVTGVFDNSLVLPLTQRSWMAGSLAPVMYWPVRTTLCSALWSDAEQLQPCRLMLNGKVLFNRLYPSWNEIPLNIIGQSHIYLC